MGVFLLREMEKFVEKYLGGPRLESSNVSDWNFKPYTFKQLVAMA